MKPYYEQGGITIYHGDCMDVLHGIGNNVNLLLSDPPYGVNYVTAWRNKSDPMRTGIQNDQTLEAISNAWPLLMAVLRDNSHFYIFSSPRRLPEMMSIVSPKQVICWDKGDAGTVGDLLGGFGEAWEAILYGMKGRRTLNGPRPRTVIRYNWSATQDPVHPTVKPIPLLKRLISMSSDTGETILDPFMGSGTTLRAAKDLGRKAIGIEIEERWCEVAAKRLSQEVLI